MSFYTDIHYDYKKGFTIVELLVVIVVIGILAAITIVSYTGISQKATEASLQSDLAGASKQLKLYQVENSAYPNSVDDCPTPSSGNMCIKSSDGNSYTYQYDNSVNPQTFSLTASHGTVSYVVTNDSNPQLVISLNCPSGFIEVPGSSTYGTSDFCVMKYEAKQASATVPLSQASGLPWNNINQADAIAYSQNVSGCTGCHLITDAEWLTIAQNVANINTNWSGGSVGSGYLYSGHNDGWTSGPEGSLAADSNDSNGYYGTNNSTPSGQRRTLALSNGVVIWDFAGNLDEWTSGTTTGGQPGIDGMGYNYREWTAITNPGSVTPSPLPSALGITGSGSWNSSNGIGKVYSSSDETANKSFHRGGSWGMDANAGIMALILADDSGYPSSYTGFRVTK